MNKVMLTGIVVRDIELKHANVDIAKVTLAVKKNFKSQSGQYDSDFINCVAWDKKAGALSQWATKGTRLGIIGKIVPSKYEDKNGVTHYTQDVWIEDFEFLTNKANNPATQEPESDPADELPF